jgi:protein TonB
MEGNPAPAYPLAARRAQREGRAVLRVVVSVAGDAGAVAVVESSGTPSLDEAALQAVRRWRYLPARRNGAPSEDVILVPVRFRLTD